ncbi:MAG: isopentenyl-diphosphate Delta-isomerase [Sphingobacteriaceae bacterium]|jgi:isopentenyl-diphosphate delta-isomerase|nr:isopentenyl-diphosphate Delta-isomerase [Sphingobacteriaceae bacterium]
MEEQVILVDIEDLAIGTMNKMPAHEQGALHRAFSIFIFNGEGELLLQQRALDKYHSAGKWTNTCCSHPRPGELTLDAAKRRLKEEMGMECELTYGFNFLYKAVFANDLIEHEIDHVFFGISDENPIINLEEVASFKYVKLAELDKNIIENPDDYTAWLKVCFNKVLDFKKINL